MSSEIFRGRVLDVDQHPIRDVNVELIVDDIKIGSVSDYEGFFLIPNIPSGNYLIKVSHIGYQSYTQRVLIPKDKYLLINMIESSIDFDRIVVTGTRSERHIKDTPMLTHVIGREDIVNSSYSNVKDILEMAMPNVQMVTSNHGNDRVKIQGLDNKYLTFLIDGDRVSGEFAGNLDFSMLGLSNVDKIEVIEGAMSTLYGSGAIGGVVNIITKKNKEPYWFNAGVQYDDPIGISPSINVGFNKGALNYNLNVQYTESDGYDLTPSAQYQDMTLDANRHTILNHRLMLSSSERHNISFIYKDYSSRTSRYDYFGAEHIDNLVIAAPLNRYDDEYHKIKYDYKITRNQNFKISYLKEKYMKYYYYHYYYSDPHFIFNPEEFVNGILDRDEINLQYNFESLKYKILIGLEAFNEDYSSFNIYDVYGEMLIESIFEEQYLTKNDNNISLYFYEERDFNENRSLSFGLRMQIRDKIVLPSISYLIKGNNNYNYRISYSGGYRSPSIKERYYNWENHSPPIYGNSNLKPTRNTYFSISLDKRTFINDFSVDIYRNDVTDMISTEYDASELYLQYKNYDKVLINGINVHYHRKITEKLKLKFVYNLTDAHSNSNEILEGISKHALRLNLYYKILNRLDVVANIKYAGKKFIFDQEQDSQENSVESLSSYMISDLYAVTAFDKMSFKIGVKNIFNYKDPNRLSSEILNNYDPGRRVFIELSLRFNGNIND